MDRLEIYEVLKYTKLGFAKKFTTGETIAIHQYVGGGHDLPESIKKRLDNLIKEIKIKRWSAPEVKYNNELALEVEYDGKWKKIN